RGTTAGHIARAALEGIAFQSADLLDSMRADAGQPVAELRVDGGASRSDPLMQFQADLLGVPVVRPAVTETTALGAAYLAGLAVGYWKSANEIASQRQIGRRFEPQMAPAKARALGVPAGRRRPKAPGAPRTAAGSNHKWTRRRPASCGRRGRGRWSGRRGGPGR